MPGHCQCNSLKYQTVFIYSSILIFSSYSIRDQTIKLSHVTCTGKDINTVKILFKKCNFIHSKYLSPLNWRGYNTYCTNFCRLIIPTLGLLKGRYSIPRIISNSMMTILYFESQEERTRVKVHRVMEDDNITIYIVSWLIGNCFAVTPRREHYKRVHVKRRNGSCQKLSEFAAKSLCIHATRFFSSFFSLVPEFVTENLERRRLERNPFIDFLFSSSSLRVIL